MNGIGMGWDVAFVLVCVVYLYPTLPCSDLISSGSFPRSLFTSKTPTRNVETFTHVVTLRFDYIHSVAVPLCTVPF